MHTKSMSETEGEFTDDKRSDRPCGKCGGVVRCRVWESSCGGYEDYKYTCTKCGQSWWVDGVDS